MTARRVAGEPLEQVVGFAEFCGLRIAVAPGVFVPRLRSTALVRRAAHGLGPGDVVVDLCCGTGAIGAALRAAVPGLEVYAADVDPAAVDCARRNLPPDRVRCGDLYDALPHGLRGRVAAVVANAPYVPTEAIATMPPEARDHERRVALDGGADGLDVQRGVISRGTAVAGARRPGARRDECRPGAPDGRPDGGGRARRAVPSRRGRRRHGGQRTPQRAVMNPPLAVTWWGHASTTVELGGVRVATDPLLSDRLLHLRRYAATPGALAVDADLVVVSHLHLDHLHLPSLRRFAPTVPILVPRGGEALLRSLGPERVVPVVPGDVVRLTGLTVRVLPASHDGRRGPHTRIAGPALGFRLEAGGASCWFPGDTGLREDMRGLGPVDLALVPVGGWGPTLGEGHLDPVGAAEAVRRVGARTAVPVHWGTFWPAGLRRIAPANHERLFVTPGRRFVDALAGDDVRVVVPGHGERLVLGPGPG